jgi:hypothetical protein
VHEDLSHCLIKIEDPDWETEELCGFPLNKPGGRNCGDLANAKAI